MSMSHNFPVSQYILLLILFQPFKNIKAVFVKKVVKSVESLFNDIPMLISQF